MRFETDVLSKATINSDTFYGEAYEFLSSACSSGIDRYFNIERAMEIVIVASTRPVKGAIEISRRFPKYALKKAMNKAGVKANNNKLWWWVEIVEKF